MCIIPICDTSKTQKNIVVIYIKNWILINDVNIICNVSKKKMNATTHHRHIIFLHHFDELLIDA